MEKRVFYSWQSDLPNKTNRGFLEDCLERAIKSLADHKLDFVLDRDTADVPGSPDVAATIFQKVDACEIFVCDVTIVSGDSSRRSPNPNVLVELGYAAGRKGWDRILCVANTAYGRVEDLPFDIRLRRVIAYQLSPDDEKSAVRQTAVGMLQQRIAEIESAGLPRIREEIIRFCNAVNPRILELLSYQHIVGGIGVNLTNRNQDRILTLLENPLAAEYLRIRSNGSFLSNNTNSNGGINDGGPGPLTGFVFRFSEAFFTSLR